MDENDNEENKYAKQKNPKLFPKNFIEENEIIIRHKKSNSLDFFLQGESYTNNSSNSTIEYPDKTKKSKSSTKLIKHVSFNPKVQITNIAKYKKETKKFSYQSNYSDSVYENDFNDETEKKCLICSIF